MIFVFIIIISIPSTCDVFFRKHAFLSFYLFVFFLLLEMNSFFNIYIFLSFFTVFFKFFRSILLIRIVWIALSAAITIHLFIVVV